jgi:hypothetical protein
LLLTPITTATIITNTNTTITPTITTTTITTTTIIINIIMTRWWGGSGGGGGGGGGTRYNPVVIPIGQMSSRFSLHLKILCFWVFDASVFYFYSLQILY